MRPQTRNTRFHELVYPNRYGHRITSAVFRDLTGFLLRSTANRDEEEQRLFTFKDKFTRSEISSLCVSSLPTLHRGKFCEEISKPQVPAAVIR